MSNLKRVRLQTYLDPSLADTIRKTAEQDDMPESRLLAKLIRLGMSTMQAETNASHR